MPCPASLLEAPEDGPAAIDGTIVAQMSEDQQTYIADRETRWAGSLDAANARHLDGLEFCAKLNEAME